jgi:hypothetical protein
MSDHVDTTEVASEPEQDGTETIEAYETDDGVVLYDAENPLAWVQTDEAVPIEDAR